MTSFSFFFLFKYIADPVILVIDLLLENMFKDLHWNYSWENLTLLKKLHCLIQYNLKYWNLFALSWMRDVGLGCQICIVLVITYDRSSSLKRIFIRITFICCRILSHKLLNFHKLYFEELLLHLSEKKKIVHLRSVPNAYGSFKLFCLLKGIICAVLALTNLPFFPNFGEVWSVQKLRSPVASQRVAMSAQVSFAALRPAIIATWR